MQSMGSCSSQLLLDVHHSLNAAPPLGSQTKQRAAAYATYAFQQIPLDLR